MDKLKYRRQFVLGPRYVNKLMGWENISAGKYLYLTSHPDLEITQIKKSEVTVTLIGFLIDPEQPSFENEDILRNLVKKSESFKDIVEKTYGYGGRWALVYADNKQTKIFHDPCGMRQVYYTKEKDKVWCGSQPNLLADFLNLPFNDNVQEFINSDSYEKTERSWIGSDTNYKNVYKLLPNHQLDIESFSTERYWVISCKDTKDLNFSEKVEVAASILEGSLQSISKRYEPMLAVTAGWDSRALLAASKNVTNDIDYFVSTRNKLNENHMDIKIPKRLAKNLSLNINVIDDLPSLSEDLRDKIKENVSMGRNLPKTINIQYHFDNSGGKINVNGNASEIVRSYYGHKHPQNITAKYLSTLAGYPSIEYVVSSLQDWLKEAVRTSELNNISLIDLFYWEQRMGNWGTMYPAEQDVAIEEFSPFNNRRILMLLLSVEEKYRRSPDYIVYKEMIEFLWKDTLSEPINPLSLKESGKKVIKNTLPVNLLQKIKRMIK